MRPLEHAIGDGCEYRTKEHATGDDCHYGIIDYTIEDFVITEQTNMPQMIVITDNSNMSWEIVMITVH